MRRRNPHAGLVVFWVKLRQRGYSRSITGLYRVLRKLGEPRKTLPNPKYIPKPYEKMLYPGQRVQIDVKFVPTACIVGDATGEKFYQYTAIDEYSRFRYIEAFQEHNSYSSAVFLEHMLKAFPFKVECVQTDNGLEFTTRLLKENDLTMFEEKLIKLGIRYKQIKPYTPRHNGKVERQNRLDQDRFYDYLKMYSLADGRRQLAAYQKKSNDWWKTCLGMRSPNDVVAEFLAVM